MTHLPRVFQHECDVLVVGAGGAGLRAAVSLAEQGFKTCVVSKVYPMRSHTGAAQGGINAALDSYDDGDTWQEHARDTIRGGDWLCDQDAVQILCENAPRDVVDLEHRGAPFSRTADGRIYQRHFGGVKARRACACADRTGHAILHTLYSDALRAKTLMYPEFFAVDLLKPRDGSAGVCGAVCYSMQDGTYHSFHASHTLLATGGAGRCYKTTTAGHPCTGDGAGLAMRAGVPIQDMEFVQFHPTGLYGVGTLISEAVRGEGGFLVNSAGERFMERYAPKSKDLASRDVVARAMAREIALGRGCGPKKDHILLQVHHLPAKLIKERLPSIAEIARLFANVDVTKQCVPVVPTAHYTMGGVPTDAHGRVVMPYQSNTIRSKKGIPTSLSLTEAEQPVPGLYAAGEAACASVHGANRLGANSVLETIVFGNEVGRTIAKSSKPGQKAPDMNPQQVERVVERVEGMLSSAGKEGLGVAEVRDAMQDAMQTHIGVFRNKNSLLQGCEKLKTIYRDVLPRARLRDRSRVMNTDLSEMLELENMILQCLAASQSALARQESRGAHAREDFPKRDDKSWLKHTLAWVDAKTGDASLCYKPVRLQTLDPQKLPTYKPEARKY